MPDTSTEPRSGLFTTGSVPVPLSGVAVEADVSTFCARVSIAHRYVNRESQPIEAVYVFPLDEGAAVCGFEAVIDGTLVVGEVKEREEAFRDYDDAMEKDHGAFLLDEERPDIFQASIGNLLPGTDVLVRLTYVTELKIADGGLRFVLPTTVSPRYAPAEDRSGVGRPDAEVLNPPVAWRVPYGLDLSVRLALPGAIRRVESPSHPVSVSLDGPRATVTLAQRDAALDRDFVLSVEAAGLDAPSAIVERGDDGHEAVAVTFVPSFAARVQPSEIIFVVDRSGSMEGTSIAEVRNALQLCLRSMVAGCHFNIIGFGSRHERLFHRSRPYDDDSLANATHHVANMKADLGGTELLAALTAALENARRGEGIRQIVLLTDGQVTDTERLVALIKEHAAHVRLFTFAIGAGASHHLVSALARAGGGAAESIFPGERIEPKVIRQFGRLLSPAMSNMRLDWGGIDATQSPSQLPPVFGGDRLLVYGLVRRAIAASCSVKLMADGPQGPVSFDVQLDPASVTPGRTVATLAARIRIRELEESPEWLKSRGSRQTSRKPNAAAAEIIDLALRYRLTSRHTSYVAIERRETPVQGDIQLRRVPVALTTGWGGLEQQPMAFGAVRDSIALSAVRASAAGSRLGRMAGRVTGEIFGWRGSHDQDDDQALMSYSGVRSMPPVSAPPDSSRWNAMMEVVNLQLADGSWALTSRLLSLLSVSRQEAGDVVGRSAGPREQAERALATALAIAWLGRHHADLHDEWRLIADKAVSWLNGIAARPDSGGWAEAGTILLDG